VPSGRTGHAGRMIVAPRRDTHGRVQLLVTDSIISNALWRQRMHDDPLWQKHAARGATQISVYLSDFPAGTAESYCPPTSLRSTNAGVLRSMTPAGSFS